MAGFWVKVPCVEELGSCHYRDACDVLNQLIPPGQDCPEPLHTYGLPCRCPFKDVSVLLPSGRDKLERFIHQSPDVAEFLILVVTFLISGSKLGLK